ncbi:MAG TPA: formylmethanofuran dehydrogenase [Geminicoccaceae bacterium]|nr:formylmethanofuran dehydrogenase [Geminicoccus sp.]HMU49515.1 formylmethanofuran dehydrogenase [Geminicoccaceae bacterium]
MTAASHADVVCPFCALLCDDLVVEADGARLRVTANGCPRAVAGFGRRVPASIEPLVDGRPVPLAEAVARAGGILRGARLPLLAGLGTDTAGMRAAVRLAEAVGGVLDHAHGAGLLANLAAMRGGGWVTATLAEARNRPDFVLLVGGDGSAVSSRLHERVLRPPRTLDSAGPPERRIVQLGGRPSAWPDIEHLDCPSEGLLAVIGALRALLAGRRPPKPDARLAALAEALRAARYALIVWAAGALPEPEATVAHLAEITKALNARGRAAGLPLSAPDNVIGANQVATWQTGVPLPLGLTAGVPEHEPRRWSMSALLARGAVDALLWVASLGDLEPPDTAAPTIVLARAGFVPKRPVEVLIPVGTPGLDHAGSLYRSDGVVALPVRGLREPVAPSVAEVLAAIATV